LFSLLDKVRSRAAEFDVLHFQIDHFHFPIFRHLPIPSLTTLHGRQDHRDCLPFFAGFSDMPLVSISDAQRAPLPHANFLATIHHGIPLSLHEASYRPKGGYVAFMGRISPEKGPDDAIRIATSLGIPLKIAAKVDKATNPISVRSWNRCCRPKASSSSAKSPRRRKGRSCAMPSPCCFRSAGPSRSASS
jgi:glycosyltransferase involved in cell wall biosynthesis